MKRILTAGVLVLLTFAGLSRASAGEGAIFNGKDLSGWQGMQGDAKNWGVKNGVLAGTGGKGSQWLATTAEYGDFDLSLEYKLPKNGNSGVFIRAPKVGTPYVDGLEIQLLDDHGEKWKNLRPNQFTGAIYAVEAPSRRVTRPAGQWQTMRILCIGKKCRVWVNGEQIIDADLSELAKTHGKKVPGLKRDSGLIGLQNHGDPASFRNIRIREVKDDGWIKLFNGRDVSGWRVNKYKHKPEWKVIDGVLTGHGGQATSPRSRTSTISSSTPRRASLIQAAGAATAGSIFAARPTLTRNRSSRPATRRSWTMATTTTRPEASTP